jgi:hypothetical protein
MYTCPDTGRGVTTGISTPEQFFDGRTDTSLHPQLSTRMHGHLCGAKNEAGIVRSSSGVRCAIVPFRSQIINYRTRFVERFMGAKGIAFQSAA